jgi:hypothetical protein
MSLREAALLAMAIAAYGGPAFAQAQQICMLRTSNLDILRLGYSSKRNSLELCQLLRI